MDKEQAAFGTLRAYFEMDGDTVRLNENGARIARSALSQPYHHAPEGAVPLDVDNTAAIEYWFRDGENVGILITRLDGGITAIGEFPPQPLRGTIQSNPWAMVRPAIRQA